MIHSNVVPPIDEIIYRTDPVSTKFRPFMQNLCLICVFFLSRDRSQSDQPLHINMLDFVVVVVVVFGVVVDGTVGFMNGRQGLEYSLREMASRNVSDSNFSKVKKQFKTPSCISTWCPDAL